MYRSIISIKKTQEGHLKDAHMEVIKKMPGSFIQLTCTDLKNGSVEVETESNNIAALQMLSYELAKALYKPKEKQITTIVLGVCSLEAAKNIEDLVYKASVQFMKLTESDCLIVNTEKKKVETGMHVLISSHDARFLFLLGEHIGRNENNICPHHNHTKYDFQAN